MTLWILKLISYLHGYVGWPSHTLGLGDRCDFEGTQSMSGETRCGTVSSGKNRTSISCTFIFILDDNFERRILEVMILHRNWWHCIDLISLCRISSLNMQSSERPPYLQSSWRTLWTCGPSCSIPNCGHARKKKRIQRLCGSIIIGPLKFSRISKRIIQAVDLFAFMSTWISRQLLSATKASPSNSHELT